MEFGKVDEFGSFLTRGKHWSVLQCRGPVPHRQRLASEHGVICYAEAHLNSFPNPKTQYGFVITGRNIPTRTKDWAAAYLRRVEQTFGVKTKGIVKGHAGAGCVQWVKWPTPSMLLEPLFLSDPEMAARIVTGEGLDGLGRCLSDSVREVFPRGGIVGLSIGHAYRGTGDKGANLPKVDADGDGVPDWVWDQSFDQEAELCEGYVVAATEMLTTAEAPRGLHG